MPHASRAWSLPTTDELLEEALALWAGCPEELKPFESRPDAAGRGAREAGLDRFLEALQGELQAMPLTRAERLATHGRITSAFTELGRGVLGLDGAQLALLLDGGLSSIGTRLARRARTFDAGVRLADILQATRNAWTASGLQHLFGRPMELTPSLFAYSMLYPYSDNYLDDPEIEVGEKRAFSSAFGARLAGEPVVAANRHERQIWRLVGLIEEEYPRAENGAIYESLLAIHRAQFRSLRLRAGQAGAEVLRVVFEKGGTSVLADAHLAAGRLTPEQARFAFFWGVVLQLGDDLQDLEEDLAAGVLTLFSEAAGRTALDGLTSRTFHFTLRALALLDELPGEPDAALCRLIRRSSLSLILRSATAAGRYHSAEFAGRLEEQSPFSLEFLERRSERLRRNGPALGRLFEAFLAGSEDEPAFPYLPGSLMPAAR